MFSILFQARALKVSPGQTQASGPVPSPPPKSKGGDSKTNRETEEILNSILPPRYIF